MASKQKLSSTRQVRLANDIAELVDAAVTDGEGRSMAEVVDRILRAEFIRREEAERDAHVDAVVVEERTRVGTPSAGVHRPRGSLHV